MISLRTLGLRLSFLLWITAFSGLLQAEESDFEPRMVLIIDDMGYNLRKGEAALALPGAVTYSILPFTPYAKRFANAAHDSGREVMLHVPMANTRAKELGPGALTADMQRQALQAGLNKALDATPHVSGVNNHMGSLLTSMEQPMNWVMETLKARDLYFIDSLTTVKTVGWKKAREAQVPYLKRHVFLDHQIDEDVYRWPVQACAGCRGEVWFCGGDRTPLPGNLRVSGQDFAYPGRERYPPGAGVGHRESRGQTSADPLCAEPY